MNLSSLFCAIGRGAVRRPRTILAAWTLILVFGLVFAPRLQDIFEREFVTGNVGEAQAAADLVAEQFTGRGAFPQLLVLSSDEYTVDESGFRESAATTIAAIEALGLTTGVDSYFDEGNEALVSADRRTTYAVLNLRSTTHSDAMTASGKLIDRLDELEQPSWLRAYVTGEEASHADLTTQSQESLSRAEAVGLPVAVIVLVLVFGALTASALPLGIALLSVMVALALAYVVGQFMDLSVFLESFATMIGLGVGIDYSLFVLNRYRRERAAGRTVEDSVVETVSHAGKAIAFSGLAVILGLAALLATEEPTIISIGIGGVLVVLVAMGAALTLLPATLVLLGDRIESPRRLTTLIHRAHQPELWKHWAAMVMRRPLPYLVFGLVVIAALAWPAFQLRPVPMGVEVMGGGAQSRQGYDVLASEFGPGTMSPLQIVVSAEDGIDQANVIAGVHQLTEAIHNDSRFAGATSITALVPGATVGEYQALYADGFTNVPPELGTILGTMVNLDGGADTTVLLAYVPEGPGAESSSDAVKALRNEVIPSVPDLAGATVLVGGTTALQLDMTDALYARFPAVVAIILGTTFVLLMVLFRSILIPLKAVVMNLLSVAAAYGALVLVFQFGFGDQLFGFESVGGINWVTPVLLFAILFGLSMDYEVFLMSRMRELHDRGQSTEESVARGLERTGGVITGAAAIMVVVFAAFMLSPILLVKELGFALAVAIFIDATVVRMVIVPSTMRMMGSWNWWLPSPLARLLPEIELEREPPEAGKAAS